MRLVTALLICGLFVSATPAAQAGIIWTMAASGNGQLYKIDSVANTTTLIGAIRDPISGDVGSGWSTVGETPDETLYFMRRFQSDINIFSVSANNIQVSGGIITNLVSRGATSLAGNLDGLANGPDGNLYFSAYDNTNPSFVRNGLFRFNPNTGVTEYVGTFGGNGGPGGVNSFYTDLAFDPITNALVGTGTNSLGQFIPYTIPAAQVLTGTNQTFTYVNAFPTWNGGLFDGLTYDPVTGALYASGDSGGVYLINRLTGAIISNVGNNAGTVVGTDLATITSLEVGAVPEPASLTLLATGGLTLAFGAWRRRIRLAKAP